MSSWYRDPQLFIYSFTCVHRITREFGTSQIVTNDIEDREILDFNTHLCLGNNKESDYDAFKASFPNYYKRGAVLKFINCQGLVVNWDIDKQRGNWSREERNSPFWSLPGIPQPETIVQNKKRKNDKEDIEAENVVLKAQVKREREEKQAVEAENTILKAKVSILMDEKEAINKRVLNLEAENAILKANQVNRVRDVNNAFKGEDMLAASLEALEKQVEDLTLKLMFPQ